MIVVQSTDTTQLGIKKTDTNQGQKMQTPKPGQHTKVEIRFLKRFVSVRNMILIL